VPDLPDWIIRNTAGSPASVGRQSPPYSVDLLAHAESSRPLFRSCPGSHVFQYNRNLHEIGAAATAVPTVSHRDRFVRQISTATAVPLALLVLLTAAGAHMIYQHDAYASFGLGFVLLPAIIIVQILFARAMGLHRIKNREKDVDRES